MASAADTRNECFMCVLPKFEVYSKQFLWRIARLIVGTGL